MKLLRFFTATIILVCYGFSYGDEADSFSNPTAGFEVTKPAGWHYISAEQNIDNLKNMKLNDEEFQAAMQKYATAPLVAMTKYAEPYDDVNPSFRVNLKPYGNLKGIEPVALLNLIIPQFESVFQDFELTQSPTDVEVSGIPSAYARLNYTMEIPDGRTFPTTSEMWIVPRGNYFFIIGAGTRQDEQTGTRSEIESILDTVTIEH